MNASACGDGLDDMMKSRVFAYGYDPPSNAASDGSIPSIVTTRKARRSLMIWVSVEALREPAIRSARSALS